MINQQSMFDRCMRVGELMSPTKIMLLKKIGCLPVVEGGRLVGLLSDTDCLRLLSALLAMRARRLHEAGKGNDNGYDCSE